MIIYLDALAQKRELFSSQDQQHIKRDNGQTITQIGLAMRDRIICHEIRLANRTLVIQQVAHHQDDDIGPRQTHILRVYSNTSIISKLLSNEISRKTE